MAMRELKLVVAACAFCVGGLGICSAMASSGFSEAELEGEVRGIDDDFHLLHEDGDRSVFQHQLGTLVERTEGELTRFVSSTFVMQEYDQHSVFQITHALLRRHHIAGDFFNATPDDIDQILRERGGTLRRRSPDQVAIFNHLNVEFWMTDAVLVIAIDYSIDL